MTSQMKPSVRSACPVPASQWGAAKARTMGPIANIEPRYTHEAIQPKALFGPIAPRPKALGGPDNSNQASARFRLRGGSGSILVLCTLARRSRVSRTHFSYSEFLRPADFADVAIEADSSTSNLLKVRSSIIAA